MVNLEPSLKVGDSFGGHVVLGHVEGVGRVLSIKKSPAGWDIEISYPLRYIIPKGSIALDGISLTVHEVFPEKESFRIQIIPYTWENTNISTWEEGYTPNVETDYLIRAVYHYISSWKKEEKDFQDLG